MTYLLGIAVDKDIQVKIGSLGDLRLEKGTYLYVGSAKRGLRPRIRRHLAKKKKIFWHIDYLLCLNATRIKQVWVSDDIEECAMAGLFAKIGYRAIDRFGSSDCNCRGHLFFIHKGLRGVQDLLKKEGIKYADTNYRSRFN